ncbi:MAG: hypothetical protein HUU46_16165 [Candidatus Hydrogenedentes bacterium]|nr:hypothetical protein [Candidatus Hydrogenedentota bacterium]
MIIYLDPKYEQQIESLAAATGKTVDEVFEELVKRALSETPRKYSAAVAENQRRAIEALLVELDALSDESPDDGFDASQHDKAIYRRDW